MGNGPGGVALTDWNCNSNGTYMSLIRKLAVACGADDCETCWRRVDQMRQVKGETTRNWGLRVMVREAAAYDRLPEHMIMRKINSVFLNGLRDAILRDRLTYEYNHTVHSISDLFKVAEQYNHSEHMFASGEITAQRDSYSHAIDYLEGDYETEQGATVSAYGESYEDDEEGCNSVMCISSGTCISGCALSLC